MRIKFLAKTPPDQDPALWSSIMPEQSNVEFTFDLEARNYDWLVVYEGLPPLVGEKKINRVETLACPRENTLLITTEPSSIRLDGPNFLRQFGHVLTNKHADLVQHPHQIQQTPPLRWFYGRPMGGDGAYKTLAELQDTPAKTHNISTVCSTKQMSHTVHAQRLSFVSTLAERMPELDVFGRGIKPIDEKSEAMDAYRYHIAIENHVEPGHWTEKLSDCFLAGCLPFYYGDPEAARAFPAESFIQIDIFDLDASEAIIRRAIASMEYEKRLDAIHEARHRVLNNYNIMRVVADIAKDKHITDGTSGAKIYGRHIFRRTYPLKAVSDFAFTLRAKHHPYAQSRQA